ncbi:MAG: DJ-1/PfpI family protein [Armatimonadetes bacterium]|nr:DJ-1/PfpI family protein [Armatimonadota bacterium]
MKLVPMNVGVLLFPGVEELDFAGPWEVLACTTKVKPPGCRVFSVAASMEPIVAANGLRVVPDFVMAEAPAPDVLIVPGGPGVAAALKSRALIAFVRHTAAQARVTASVCTGAFILERAGLLCGRRATTHASALTRLGACPGVTAVSERWVDEGEIVTSAGVSAGIDMAIHLVKRLFDSATAEEVCRRLELA